MTDLVADDFSMSAPVYTLNLTAAQRCTLEWLICHDGLYKPLTTNAVTIGEACTLSASTVHEALARLNALHLIIRETAGVYRVNPRFLFSQNPELARLATEALTAPDVALDERAQEPRRASAADMRRRSMRSV